MPIWRVTGTSVGGTTTGASFTGTTVIVRLTVADALMPPFAVPPLSPSVTLIVAVPNALAAGVKLRSPVTALIAGPALNSAGLVFPASAKLSTWVPPSPSLIAVAHGWLYAPESSLTDGFAPGVKLGASLTGCTFSVNAWLVLSWPPFAVPPLSCRVAVIVALPNAPGAAV